MVLLPVNVCGFWVFYPQNTLWGLKVLRKIAFGFFAARLSFPQGTLLRLGLALVATGEFEDRKLLVRRLSWWRIPLSADFHLLWSAFSAPKTQTCPAWNCF